MTIFNKFFDKNRLKDIDLRNSTSNTSEDGFTRSHFTSMQRNKKDFSVINKSPKIITVLEQDTKHYKDDFSNNNQVFYSYLEKLKKITNDVKKLNEAKLLKASNPSYLFRNNINHKEELLKDYKFVRYKLKGLSKSMKDSTINSDYKSSVSATKVDIKNRTKESVNEHNVVHNSVQHSLYNAFVLEVNNKIDYLVNILTSYFDEILAKLSNFSDNKDEVREDSFNNKFTDLSNNILDIKKLCDLNGMDIDNLNDSLNKINFHELINILKEINLNTHKLVNKQENLNQGEIEVSNEIKSLKSNFKAYSKEQLDALTKKLSALEEKQYEYSIIQTENKNTIVNEIKNVLHSLQSTSNPTLELQDKLNIILAKQENLLQEALNIKSHIASNSKNVVEECNQSEKGLSVLIEEIKSNNTVVKEQNVFSEKIHKDMEVIKKSIIKLIDEQTKENNKVLNTTESKSSSDSVLQQVSKHSSDKNNFLNNEETVKESNSSIKKVDQDIYKSKVNNYKDVQKSNQVKNAIGKLKEALDLDSIHTVKELHTEYIDEIIEEKFIDQPRLEKVQNNSKTSSSSYSTTKNKVSPSEVKTGTNKTNKNSQSTFILDNSKFFK